MASLFKSTKENKQPVSKKMKEINNLKDLTRNAYITIHRLFGLDIECTQKQFNEALSKVKETINAMQRGSYGYYVKLWNKKFTKEELRDQLIPLIEQIVKYASKGQNAEDAMKKFSSLRDWLISNVGSRQLTMTDWYVKNDASLHYVSSLDDIPSHMNAAEYVPSDMNAAEYVPSYMD
jgi:hypothetical protein